MIKKVLFLTLICSSLTLNLFAQSATETIVGKPGKPFVDNRDSKSYKTVLIGEQTWMAENLNYATENSSYYDNSESNGEKYGRLYGWEEAQNVCPSGWHLPSDEEWKILESAIGLESAAINVEGYRGTNQASILKSGGSSGLNILMAGYRYRDGSFRSVGQYGDYWTSSSADQGEAWYRNFSSLDQSIYRNKGNKVFGGSVRCVKD